MSDTIENKQRKPNLWLEHVKNVRETNPNLIYKDCLKLAKESYHAVEKLKKENVRKRPSKLNDLQKVRKRKSKSEKSEKLDEELQSELIEAY